MNGKDTVLELVEGVGHGSFATVWKTQWMVIYDGKERSLQ